jgi:intracellular septation protein
MKLLADLLPVLLFFIVFKLAGSRPEDAAAFASAHLGFLVAGGVVAAKIAPMLLATLTAIGVTAVQIAWKLARGQKVDTMLWVSLAVVAVFGGATVWFQNETFIKWKPSVLYWLMGGALALTQLLTGRSLLRTLLGEQLTLPDPVWRRLTLMWVAFFAFMGLANLFVAYQFSTEIWVDFKLFGGIGLMLLFTLAQGLYLSRHIEAGHE